MSTQILESYQIVDEFIDQRPVDSKLVLHDVSWEEYEAVLDKLVDPAGLRIAYDDGTLQIMTTSAEHEKYARFLERLITVIQLRKRLTILSFGSATMRKRKKTKGNEPDACFYVQSAPLIGNRVDVDFEIDPPPDVAVEIDLHRDSISKFSIYAGLGVAEIWRYDGNRLKIDLLEGEDYVSSNQSRALPMLTSAILTNSLRRMREEGDSRALLEFDNWIQNRPT